MKLLIVCQYYWPEQFLINEIAPQLVRNGHEVTVLTGLPNYPSGIVPNEYKKEKRDEIIDGVRVIRTYEKGRGTGKISMILNYLSYMISASHKAKKLDKFDLVICYQLSPITMMAPAIAYKKKHHVPVLTYCLDIWPESAQAHIGKGILYKLVSKYTKKLYQQCDRIAVTSDPFISYLNEVNGVPKDRLVYIPQHANGDMVDMDLSSEDNGVADFMFAGNLGKGQKIETIVYAAAKLREKSFLVHIVGDGSMKSELEQLTERLHVQDKFIFHGQQSRDKMPEWYRKADALLITLRGNNYVGNTMPGKLQTYMTVGKPIFGAINGAAMQVIDEARCGVCVPAEDADGLAKIMLDYIDHPEKYTECGKMARDYFKKHFTMDVFMDSLEKEIRTLV